MVSRRKSFPWLRKQHSVLPGFGLTMGFSLLYLSLIVLIPLAACFSNRMTISWSDFWKTITDPRVVASFKLTFGASLVAASINAFFGLIVAWVLVRYSFPGKKIVDAMIDLPFAMPTAVSGIALTSIYSHRTAGSASWFDAAGHRSGLYAFGHDCGADVHRLAVRGAHACSRRLEDMEAGIEEAAASLGATPLANVPRRSSCPRSCRPGSTGFALAFARALGEYGSVVFIAGNMPMKTEITPLMIITSWKQYQYGQAAAIAVVTLVASFAIIVVYQFVAMVEPALCRLTGSYNLASVGVGHHSRLQRR